MTPGGRQGAALLQRQWRFFPQFCAIAATAPRRFLSRPPTRRRSPSTPTRKEEEQQQRSRAAGVPPAAAAAARRCGRRTRKDERRLPGRSWCGQKKAVVPFVGVGAAAVAADWVQCAVPTNPDPSDSTDTVPTHCFGWDAERGWLGSKHQTSHSTAHRPRPGPNTVVRGTVLHAGRAGGRQPWCRRAPGKRKRGTLG